MEIVLLSLWLPGYIVSVAVFLFYSGSFAAAIRMYSCYFNSRAVGESPSLQEILAFQQGMTFGRRSKRAYGDVVVLFFVGAVLISFLTNAAVWFPSEVALGASFLICAFASLRVLERAEEFDDAICQQRYNPGRGSEFM